VRTAAASVRYAAPSSHSAYPRQMAVWVLLMLTVEAVAAVGTADREKHRLILEPELCCGWAVEARSGSNSPPLPFNFVVRARGSADGLARVQQAALNVSTPTHRDYGKHLSQRTIDAMTAPSAGDTATVRAWLRSSSGCVVARVVRGRSYEVECAEHTAAERLLRTSFRRIRNAHTGQVLARPTDCWLPESVQAVFGLHELPLPLSPPAAHYKAPLNTSAGGRDGPALDGVTPATIGAAYNCTYQVVPRKGSPNKQAVVAFSDAPNQQTMNQTDLRRFYSLWNGDDVARTVKFVGEPGHATDKGDMESSLDIQYITGVGGGVATEFWHFTFTTGFCQAVHNWTQHLLADGADTPLVNSMSYGWQGNLTMVGGCPPESRAAIDEDFAQLAAKGITLIVSSGDDGSGSGGGQMSICRDGAGAFDSLQDTALDGTPVSTYDADGVCDCHDDADGRPYTYTPGKAPQCTIYEDSPELGSRAQAGSTSRRSHTLPLWSSWPAESPFVTSVGATSNTKLSSCFPVLYDLCGAARRVSQGRCFSCIGKEQSALRDARCTRAAFDQYCGADPSTGKVLLTEVASTHFGSGGGFSMRYQQADHASWQTPAVKHFVDNLPGGTRNSSWHDKFTRLPPRGALSGFDASARATPDVSMVGEDYQVLLNGQWQTVDGTSASAPAFAGLVSLLNERRIQSGKPRLGWLNPWLYSADVVDGGGFIDVKNGTNAINIRRSLSRAGDWDTCKLLGRPIDTCISLKFGFNASHGWDAVTGLGTPDFGRLLDLLPAN
jgi:hypothetical protein